MRVFLDHSQESMFFALIVINRNGSILCFNVTVSVELILLERSLNDPFMFLEDSIYWLVIMKLSFKNLAWRMCDLSRALPQIIYEISFIAASVLVHINSIAFLFSLLKVSFISLAWCVFDFYLSMRKAIFKLTDYVKLFCFSLSEPIKQRINKSALTEISILVC